MKTLFTTILFFFAVTTFAQGSVKQSKKDYFKFASAYEIHGGNSDTLTIPVGKYKFIKIGDKVYKLNTTLEEVKEDPQLQIWNGESTIPVQPYQDWRLDSIDIKVDSILFYDGEKLVPGTPEGLWQFKPNTLDGNVKVDSSISKFILTPQKAPCDKCSYL